MEKSYGERIIDFLLTAPVELLENRLANSITEAPINSYIGIKIKVESVFSPPRWKRRSPWRVLTTDAKGDSLVLVFFHNKGGYLQRLFTSGKHKIVFGNITDNYQMLHPKMVLDPQKLGAKALAKFRPVYPKSLQPPATTVTEALSLVPPNLPEWLPNPPAISFADALKNLHQPPSTAAHQTALKRLAFDELFARQIMLAIENKQLRKGIAITTRPPKIKLPFELTQAQQKAVAKIAEDLAAPTAMNRLLQGDVGSGKTIVAILAMLQTAQAGYQAVLMAPTEALAEQHYNTLLGFSKTSEVLILKGSQTQAQKRDALKHIADGNIRLIVGTHSLFQEKVRFAKLGLAIIDEQQRFGVAQRANLAKKGKGVNMLSLSATPIPRSLALGKYLGINLTTLEQKPKGRLPTKTSMVAMARLAEVTERLHLALQRGEQAFWICPAIENGEESSLENRYAYLKNQMPDQNVVQAHGAMPVEERTQSIAEFKTRKANLLIATTVVEVGIDIPSADIMVVENAERFGLAQLHQLRGRIGRGGGKGKMLGIHSQNLSPLAKERLDYLQQSDDGFFLAQKDLELRKSGELLGTRQSGLEGFRLFTLEQHHQMIEPAHHDALNALKPPVNKQPLHHLLTLFGFESSIALI